MQAINKVLVATSILCVAYGSFAIARHGDLVNSARADETVTAKPADAAAVLMLGSNTIADMAEKVAPAVVNIENDQPGPTMMSGFPFELPFGGGGNGFKFFFNGQEVQPGGPMGPGGPGGPGPKGHNPPGAMHGPERKNTGSGVIIRKDGYILTNAHVVRGAEKLKVRLVDGKVLAGKVVGIDNFSDVAVVKIDGDSFPTAELGTSSSLRPGEFAVAIGNPLGLDHTVTMGIISAVKRDVSDVNGNINFIQTDAAINPGNSGGPLLNLKGEVIGINTAMQTNAQNIGFSIPIDIARGVADDLIANRKIVRPWLGIAMQPIDDVMAKSLGLATNSTGVLIGQVMDGSPAKAAGLQTGDVIQKIDGKDMTNPKEVQDYVRAHKVSETLHFFVIRKNAPQAVAVNIGTYPDGKVANGEEEQPEGPVPVEPKDD